MQQSLSKILSQFAERKKLSNSPEALLTAYHHGTRVSDQIYAERPFYLIRNYYQTINEAFVEKLTVSVDPDDYTWLVRQQTDIIFNDLILKPDCHNVLDTLKARGFYLSIVSNIDEEML